MNLVSEHGGRHPWRAVFMAYPDRELDRLLAGYARVQGLTAAEPADIALAVFGPPGTDPEGVEALDRAVLAWLRARRMEGGQPLRDWGRPRALRAIMDALDIVGAMQLPVSAIEINRRTAVWYRWAERLKEDDAPDVLAALLTAVAVTQRLVARQPGGVGAGLEGFWLDLAERAGSLVPQTYLQQALLGLRRLPEKDSPPERLWMTGLARWAAARRPSGREFAFEWRGLRAVYPHVPAYWRDLLEDTLAQHGVHLPEDVRDVWQNDLGRTASDGERTGRRHARIISPPPLRDVKDMEGRVGLPLAAIQADLNRIIAEHKRYAEATGEDHFLVTTVCNLGQLLLKKSPGGEEARRGELMQKAARMALKWQPGNVYAWALWRDAIFAQGYADDAESIGWASISRFPEEPHRRAQLADILVQKRESRGLARMLLTESLARFPDKDGATLRNQLVELLIATGRLDDARSVIAASTVITDATFSLKARLAFQTDRAEAVRIVQQGLKQFPDSVYLQAYARTLQSGGELLLLSDLYRQPEPENRGRLRSEDDELLLAARREGRARRLRTEQEFMDSDEQWGLDASATVQRDLAEDPESESLKYLAKELGVAAPSARNGQPTSFATALATALTAAKAVEKPTLNRPMTPVEHAIMDVSMIYLYGDDEACERVSAWIQQPAPQGYRAVLALRQFLLTRTNGKVDAESLKGLVANDNVAADLIETALIPMAFAA